MNQDRPRSYKFSEFQLQVLRVCIGELEERIGRKIRVRFVDAPGSIGGLAFWTVNVVVLDLPNGWHVAIYCREFKDADGSLKIRSLFDRRVEKALEKVAA